MAFNSKDEGFMRRAVVLALQAERQGNLPVGAVMALEGEVVAEGKSAIWFPKFDATRHAEMEALRAVPAKLWTESRRMSLYTTLEPCVMCLGAILLHRVGRVVFGSADCYGGAEVILAHLPPFFAGQFSKVQFLGPVMPAECDPLHERLLATESARQDHLG